MQYFFLNIDHQSMTRTYVQNFMRKYWMVLINGGTYVKMNPKIPQMAWQQKGTWSGKCFLLPFQCYSDQSNIKNIFTKFYEKILNSFQEIEEHIYTKISQNKKPPKMAWPPAEWNKTYFLVKWSSEYYQAHAYTIS